MKCEAKLRVNEAARATVDEYQRKPNRFLKPVRFASRQAKHYILIKMIF